MMNSAASARAVAWFLFRSPHALRVIGIGLLGVAGIFLLVAKDARWLCEGQSLPHCASVEVPGVSTCAFYGALATCVAGSVHFLGSAGLCGAAYNDYPPSLVELAEADTGDEEDGMTLTPHESNRQTIHMEIQSVGVLRWDISLAANLLPKVSVAAVRLLAWFAHLSATVLSVLGVVLAWAEEDSTRFLAEAAYLDLGAILCLASGAAAFRHESTLWGALADQWSDKWQTESRPGQGHSVQQRWRSTFGAGTGGSGDQNCNSPTLTLEDFAQRAQRKIKTTFQEAEHLAQPLLDAQHCLQSHIDQLILTQPLVDARQRIQEHLDAIQAGSVAQGSSRAAPDWIQPLLGHLAPRQGSGPSTEATPRQARMLNSSETPFSADGAFVRTTSPSNVRMSDAEEPLVPPERKRPTRTMDSFFLLDGGPPSSPMVSPIRPRMDEGASPGRPSNALCCSYPR